MKLSIVTTLYQSAPYIKEFYERASNAAKKLVGDDYEIVMVNDGSPDKSLELVVNLTTEDSHVVVIDLSRNFGHHKAVMAGLAQAKGESIFLIDSDLEEPPEILDAFHTQMNESRDDVVYGVQEKRKGGFAERISGFMFWRLFNLLTGLGIVPNLVTARLMTRRYLNALLLHEEKEIMLAGLFQITGFNQKPFLIKKSHSAQTTYTLKRKIALLVNAITSFSSVPLVAIFYVGLFVFIIASLFTSFLVMRWFFFQKPLMGWTSLIASVWMIGGMILCSIGVVGIYIAKIFSEVKGRPLTIIRNIYQNRSFKGKSL